MNSGRIEASTAHNHSQETRPSPPPPPLSETESEPPQGSFDISRTATIRQDHPVFWMHAASPAISVNAEPGSTSKAIVSEIRMRAMDLIEQSQTHIIDLRFLKSMPEERAILASLLGRGEVSAVVDSIGRSEIQETAIPCVWWIRHLNSEEEMVGEVIEIADVPDLLMSDRNAVADALEALNLSLVPRTC